MTDLTFMSLLNFLNAFEEKLLYYTKWKHFYSRHLSIFLQSFISSDWSNEFLEIIDINVTTFLQITKIILKIPNFRQNRAIFDSQKYRLLRIAKNLYVLQLMWNLFNKRIMLFIKIEYENYTETKFLSGIYQLLRITK